MKAWSYQHEVHGADFSWDAYNKPYALLWLALTLRSGCISKNGLQICGTCHGVDLYEFAAKVRLIPPTVAALAYTIFKHSIRSESTVNARIEKIGDMLECCGAMCDTTLTKPREFQSHVSSIFPLVAEGCQTLDRKPHKNNARSEDVFRICQQIFIQFNRFAHSAGVGGGIVEVVV